METPVVLKKCQRCDQEKPLEDFTVNRRRLDGHEYFCRTCKAAGRTYKPARTREERNRHIRIVVGLLGRGYSDYEIRSHLEKEVGCGHSRAWETLQMARAVLRGKLAPKDRHGKPDPRLLVVDALAVYEEIIRNPNAKHADIIAAQTRKDRLLGLETIKIHTTLDATIKTEITVRNIVEIAEKNDMVRDLMLRLSEALPEIQ